MDIVSVFTKIIHRDIPAHIIAEDSNFIAFLDINPLAKGHTLVVPKTQIDYIFDLDDPILSKILIFGKQVAQAIQQSVACLRVGIAVVGLEVPHAHIHLVPLQGAYDIDFKKSPLSYSNKEMADIAESIKANISIKQ